MAFGENYLIVIGARQFFGIIVRPAWAVAFCLGIWIFCHGPSVVIIIASVSGLGAPRAASIGIFVVWVSPGFVSRRGASVSFLA